MPHATAVGHALIRWSVLSRGGYSDAICVSRVLPLGAHSSRAYDIAY